LKENAEERKLTVSQLIAKSFGAIMVVLYMVIGTTIIFRAPEMRNIPEVYAVVIGVLLILYGFFRGYKLYRKHFSDPVE
jgi:uncharacterized protein YacL